jgi:transposase-like protein
MNRDEIKGLFGGLVLEDQRELLEELLREQELSGQILQDAEIEVSLKREKKPCPYCSSAKVYKRGKQNGVQMYRCREEECLRWYSETTGTALYEIKLKDKWQSYLNCMEQGLPIKKIAQKLNISIQTSFDWRHKILSSLEQFIPDQLTKEVECDELELPVSEKGNQSLTRPARKRSSDFKRNDGSKNATTVQIVTAVQRDGQKVFRAVETKRLSKADIEKALEGKLAEGVTLITDKHPSYRAFAKDHPKIKHKTLLAKDHVDKKDKTIHLQKVNHTHKEMRTFLRPFNGVSSKYLQNYLNWFAYKENISNSKTMLKLWFTTILLSEQSQTIFQLFKESAVLVRT